jgi:hypothetical protein
MSSPSDTKLMNQFMETVHKQCEHYGGNRDAFVARFLQHVIQDNLMSNKDLQEDIAWRIAYLNKETRP